MKGPQSPGSIGDGGMNDEKIEVWFGLPGFLIARKRKAEKSLREPQVHEIIAPESKIIRGRWGGRK